jgi:hypothetical protein
MKVNFLEIDLLGFNKVPLNLHKSLHFSLGNPLEN